MYPKDTRIFPCRPSHISPAGKPIGLRTNNQFVSDHSHRSCKHINGARFLECATTPSSDDSIKAFNCFDPLFEETRLITDLVGETVGKSTSPVDSHSTTLESEKQNANGAQRKCLRVPTLQESLENSGIKRRLTNENRDEVVAKRIQWTNMQLYGHNVILADNPAVSAGPAIGLGWEVLSIDHLSIDQFEEFRPPRRHREQLILPRSWREIQLLEEGYRRGEIKVMSDELDQMKRHRKLNANLSLSERIRMAVRSRLFKSAKASFFKLIVPKFNRNQLEGEQQSSQPCQPPHKT